MTEQRASPDRAAPVFVPDFCDPARRRLVLVAAILASALGFIDGSVVSIAVPAIRESLGAGLAEVQWVNNAYMLTLCSLILVGGAFGDRFGLGRVFAGGIALFVAASLFCALAPSAAVLIPARALQGIGAAFMVPGSLAIISRAYPRDERGAAIGTWAAASALTTALGPIIGGLALTLGGAEMWRWIFAINLPLGALAIWLVRRAVRDDPARSDRAIDLPGAALAVLGLGLIAWALTGASHGGGAERPALFAAAGGLALAGFLFVERQSAAPMLDLALFRSRVFSAANLATFCLYFALSAILFFLPMTVIAGWGISEIEATAAFAPLTVFIAALSGRFGRLADTVGPGPLIAGGAAIVALAFAALALGAGSQRFWGLVVPAMCVMGFGMSLVVAPLSAAVMGAVPDESSGTASGVNNAVSRMAGLIAVAAMGSVAALAYGAAGGPGEFGAASDTAGHLAATNAGFAAVAWGTAALSALAALIAWVGIPRRRAGGQTGS